MTLILTECARPGVVMAADSAITRMRADGTIVSIDQKGWKKVLRAPRIKALVGYWGHIGRVYGGRFDEWLESRLKTLPYTTLPELAEALANELNAKVGNAPLGDDVCVGLHVAGIHPWADGVARAFFFHVHNGPGHYVATHATETTSLGEVITEVRPEWIGGPRTEFYAHQDFPSPSHTLEENLLTLERGYITRNGNFLYHAIAWDRLRETFAYLNLIPGFSVPARKDELGPRRGLLVAALETSIAIFRCSNQPRIVGGKVIAEAVGPRGYLRI